MFYSQGPRSIFSKLSSKIFKNCFIFDDKIQICCFPLILPYFTLFLVVARFEPSNIGSQVGFLTNYAQTSAQSPKHFLLVKVE
jgi:hypothetical protein